jgi:hypothetical protein
MSNTAAPKQSACLDTIIGFLLPYFAGAAADPRSARADVVETLISYGTRTRAEFLQAAQIIALSMTTLEVLHEAKTTEMSPSMRIRHRGNANSLNRAAVQTQKALDHSLACEVPERPRPPAAPNPIDDMTDAEAQAMVDQARAAVEAYRNRFAPNVAHSAPHQHSTGQRAAGPNTPAPTAHRQTPAAGP